MQGPAAPAGRLGLLNEEQAGTAIRVFLLEEQALLRTSLSRLLGSQSGIEVIGDCGYQSEALQMLVASEADIALLACGAAAAAPEFIRATRQAGFRGRFLLLAETVDACTFARALKSGASGIFSKSEAPDLLIRAIRLVAYGSVWIDEKTLQLISDQLLERLPPLREKTTGSQLKEREEKVLLGIVSGLSNQRISESIGVSLGAVKGIIQQLFQKAGVRTRSQLVRLALEGFWGDIEPSARREAHDDAAPGNGLRRE